MSQIDHTRSEANEPDLDWVAGYFSGTFVETPFQFDDPVEYEQYLDAFVRESIQQNGFTATLRELTRFTGVRRTRPKGAGIYTVVGGVLEVGYRGEVDAALDTEEGERFVVQKGLRIDCPFPVPETSRNRQFMATSLATNPELPSARELLARLSASDHETLPFLLCATEFTEFDPEQSAILLPILWKYILDHRNSSQPDELTAVGAGIRKYIAIMPMDRMSELAVFLTPANQVPLPLELELEVVKMIFRNFEAHPPKNPDPEPALATRLWEMVAAYLSPRILLRDKYSAVASLAIEALVAMWSRYAAEAWSAALECQYTWFGEMVTDDLRGLSRQWSKGDGAAAEWLEELRIGVFGRGERQVPSTRESGQSVAVGLYDVIGTDGDSPRFIRHTGLASKSGEQTRQEVEVHEMVPPWGSDGRMAADVIGKVNLSEGELRKIKVFLDRHENEHRSLTQISRHNICAAYSILPHAIPYTEKDGRYVRMRFSCAGLVIEAYRFARIQLLDEQNVPLITLDKIKLAYPTYRSFLDRDEFRQGMGLMGAGPWRVVLCGYIFNSVNRHETVLRERPYVPMHGDEVFPRG